MFDTLFIFENYPVDRAGLAAQANGLRLGRVEGHDATHYPLALMVRPGEETELRLDWRPDLFDEASVAALGRRYVQLLEGMASAPERALGSLSILEEAERETLLRTWNDTATWNQTQIPRAGALLPRARNKARNRMRMVLRRQALLLQTPVLPRAPELRPARALV